MKSKLSIAIFGNTNNYPLLLAEGLKLLGHDVRLILNRTEVLHRPEAKHPEWKDAYPPWVHDCSDLTDEDIAYATPALEPAIRHLTHNVDLAILNDVGPALIDYITAPHVALLTGSDLTYYASYDSLQMRTGMWDSGFKRSPAGRRFIRRMADFVSRQRDGLLSARVVCYAYRGLIPEGDRLLDAIGVDNDRRMMLLLSNVHGLAAQPSSANKDLQVLCGSRIVYRPERNPALSTIDFKGTDVLIQGFAAYCQRGGKGELQLPQKGQDIELARSLVHDLGIASRVVWLPEMSLAEFYERMTQADIVCDQFGTSFPGMVTMDAYALGRPVMAKLRNEVFSEVFTEPLPGFDVHTSEDIAECLLQLDKKRDLLKSMGAASRAYATAHLSPEVMASQLLLRCDV